MRIGYWSFDILREQLTNSTPGTDEARAKILELILLIGPSRM